MNIGDVANDLIEMRLNDALTHRKPPPIKIVHECKKCGYLNDRAKQGYATCNECMKTYES